MAEQTVTAEVREVETPEIARRPDLFVCVWATGDPSWTTTSAYPAGGWAHERYKQLRAQGVPALLVRIPGEPEPELLKQLRRSVALLNTETTNEG